MSKTTTKEQKVNTIISLVRRNCKVKLENIGGYYEDYTDDLWVFSDDEIERSNSIDAKPELMKLSDSELDEIYDSVIETDKYIAEVKESGISVRLALCKDIPINKSQIMLVSLKSIGDKYKQDYKDIGDSPIYSDRDIFPAMKDRFVFDCGRINKGNLIIYPWCRGLISHSEFKVLDITNLNLESQSINVVLLIIDTIFEDLHTMGSDSYDDETKDILNITDKLPIILDSTVIDKFVQYIKNYVTDKEKFESLKAAIEPYALASKQIHLFDMLANLIPLRWYQIALNNGIPVVNLTDIYKKYSRFKNYSDYLVDSMNDVSIDLMNNMVELLSLKEWTTDYKTLKPTSEYNTLLWKCCTNLKQ